MQKIIFKFKQNWWVQKRRTQLYIGSDELKTSFSKFKGSVFAIIFGLLAGSIVIAATGNNIFIYFQYVIFYAFSNVGFNNWDKTLVWWSLYIVSGVALVIAFRTGLFNIGVAGQMMAAGIVILVIGIRFNLSQPLMLIFALFAGILAASLVAAAIAFLKFKFNIHEVVSSILINWMVLFLIKYIVMQSTDLYSPTSISTKSVNDSLKMEVAGYKFIIPLILAALMVISVWFLLKNTTFGYKIKTVGLNPFAADYAGIKQKYFGFVSFVISGAIIGIMAFIYYVGLNPSISFSSDLLPSISFDSISVALVGQINSWGVIGSAFLWAVIQNGGPIGSVGLQIPNAIGDIIFGVIIYSAACAILLSKLKPLQLIAQTSTAYINSKSRKKVFTCWIKIWSNLKEILKIKNEYSKKRKILNTQIKKYEKDADQISKLKLNLNEINQHKIDYIKIKWSLIRQNFQAKHHFIKENYQYYWTTGKFGINKTADYHKKELFGLMLNDYISVRNDTDEKIHFLKFGYHKKVANDKAIIDHKKIKGQIENLTKLLKISFSKILENEQKLLAAITNKKIKAKNKFAQEKKIANERIKQSRQNYFNKVLELKANNQFTKNSVKDLKNKYYQEKQEIFSKLREKKYFDSLESEK